MSKRPEAYPAFRFAVQIDGITEAVFSECTLPSSSCKARYRRT
jgi:hypothetical protein